MGQLSGSVALAGRSSLTWPSRVPIISGMPGDSLHAAVEALRTRLQSDLDAQLAELQTRLESHQQEAVAIAARAAATAADEAWAARFAAASAEADQARADDRTRLEAEHAAALDAARAAAVPPHDDSLTELSAALTRIGQAASLSATLDALLHGAAAHADRVTLFVAADGGGSRDGWIPWNQSAPDGPDGRDLATTAGRSGRVETSDDGSSVAVPLIVGDRPVAVLHARRTPDLKVGPAPTTPPTDIIVVLALHGAACLARLTAVRVTQVVMGTPVRPVEDDASSARRYAKLLVSEIKLYNEAAVRTGREHGDLLARLGPEIARARRLYEQRVPASRERAALFQHELVHTLAAGDATRLGAS